MNKRKVKSFIEQDAYPVIERIAEDHSKKTFAYLDRDDLRQEIWCICIEALHGFDPDKGNLEHWLRKVVSNRMKNVFHSVYKRITSPCSRCEHYCKDECSLYAPKELCSRYSKYIKKVQTQRAMMSCGSLENTPTVPDGYNYIEEVDSLNLYNHIVNNLPSGYVEDFMVMASGYTLSSPRRNKIRKSVKTIFRKWDDNE